MLISIPLKLITHRSEATGFGGSDALPVVVRGILRSCLSPDRTKEEEGPVERLGAAVFAHTTFLSRFTPSDYASVLDSIVARHGSP
jgi:hypothetical protein